MITSGGANIASIEVRGRALLPPRRRHGRRSRPARPQEWGETPLAYVELKPGTQATEAELIEYRRARLPHLKAPQPWCSRGSPRPPPAKSKNRSCATGPDPPPPSTSPARKRQPRKARLPSGATHAPVRHVTLCHLSPGLVALAEPPLGAAVRGEPSSVVDAHIRLFCWVGGVAKAPVTAVVQPVIKHERQGRGGRPGPHAGLCTAHVERLNSWQRAMRAGVVP